MYHGREKTTVDGDYDDRWVVRSEKGQQRGKLRGSVYSGMAWRGKGRRWVI